MGPCKESELSNDVFLSPRKIYEVQTLSLLHPLVRMFLSFGSSIITQAFSEEGIVLAPTAETHPCHQDFEGWLKTWCGGRTLSDSSHQRRTVMLSGRAMEVCLEVSRWQSGAGNMSTQLESQCIQERQAGFKLRVGCRMRRGWNSGQKIWG